MSPLRPEIYQDFEQAFVQGRCEDIVAASVDTARTSKTELRIWPLVIGSLAFLGRVNEAEVLLQTRYAEFSEMDRTASRCYLIMALTQTLQYTRASAYSLANVQAFRRSSSPLCAFYAWQGAFCIYQLSGRYVPAFRAAEKALTAALQSEDPLARMLATFSLGQVRVELGEIARGLSELEMAYRLAHRLRHPRYMELIYQTLVCYRVQYGLASQDAISSLQELMYKAQSQANTAELQLELARQLTLRGRLQDAEKLLQDLSSSLNAKRNRRELALIQLRLAEIASLRRDPAGVSEKLRLARNHIDPQVDRVLLLHWLGLVYKSQTNPPAVCLKPLLALTRKIGSAWAQRLAARLHSSVQHPLALDDDPLGDVLDQARTLPIIEQVSRLLTSGYLGFLARILPLEGSSRLIYVHPSPRTLIVYDRGDIRLFEVSSSSKIFDLIQAFAKGLCSHEALVGHVWGYSYHPLRHDSLLYSLISRLRLALGDWLQNTSEGYRIQADVRIVIPAMPALRQAPKMNLTHPTLVVAPADLNTRQISILNHLRWHPWIGLDDCVRLFRTSKVTATRDLSALVKVGLIHRVGRGRATRYASRSAEASNNMQPS